MMVNKSVISYLIHDKDIDIYQLKSFSALLFPILREFKICNECRPEVQFGVQLHVMWLRIHSILELSLLKYEGRALSRLGCSKWV